MNVEQALQAVVNERAPGYESAQKLLQQGGMSCAATATSVHNATYLPYLQRQQVQVRLSNLHHIVKLPCYSLLMDIKNSI